MKWIAPFRNKKACEAMALKIRTSIQKNRSYHFMEFCGGHTHVIFSYGIYEFLPSEIQMIHGPGCPVCVLPVGRLEMAMRLLDEKGITLCTYGDMMRVPGVEGRSLLSARAKGADVRLVYSAMDVLQLAKENPKRQIVFFAIGFETTAPATALLVQSAAQEGLSNLSIFCNHVLTPAAIQHVLEAPPIRNMCPVKLDGFLGPGHVSTIIGTKPYKFFAEEYRKPVVISGFEPLDIFSSIYLLVKQVNEGRYDVENEYRRCVSEEGNPSAKKIVAEVFELRKEFRWRGLGLIPYSALKLRSSFHSFDAEERFSMEPLSIPEPHLCQCPAVIRGVRLPLECPLFGSRCTPQTPIGSCMVSQEGVCAAYFQYERKDYETYSSALS